MSGNEVEVWRGGSGSECLDGWTIGVDHLEPPLQIPPEHPGSVYLEFKVYGFCLTDV